MKLITTLDANNKRCLTNPRNREMINFSTEKVALRNAERISREICQDVTVINQPINGRDIFYLTVENYIE